MSKYYDTYYATCQFWESKYTENFKVFNTACLNSEVGVKSILEFIGIEEPNVVTGIQKRKH